MGGHDSGSVEDQWVQILADSFTVTDEDSIPTGEIRAVEGTPMDFRKGKRIGEEIGADDPVLVMARGYDHNFVLNGTGLRTVARMYAEKTGIAMEVETDFRECSSIRPTTLRQSRGKKERFTESEAAPALRPSISRTRSTIRSLQRLLQREVSYGRAVRYTGFLRECSEKLKKNFRFAKETCDRMSPEP